MNYEFDVINFVENYLNKKNSKYVLYDPPVWEYLVGTEVKTWLSKEDVPNMIFIYFTARNPEAGEHYKIYYQLVIGCYGVEIYYQNENVIDRNKNLPISDVKLRFTNWCKYMLERLDVSSFQTK